MRDPILTAGIDLLVLAIGEPDKVGSLRALAQSVGGKVFDIGRTAQLPRLMQQQILAPRLSPRTDGYSVQTVVEPSVRGLPSPDELHWKNYQRVTPKPDAEVYWRSELGDPLWIVGRAGLGRVNVISGGIGRWLGGEGKPQFTQALLQSLTGNRIDSGLDITTYNLAGAMLVKVEWVDAEGWVSLNEAQQSRNHKSGGQKPIKLVMKNPLGVINDVILEEEVPGRFFARLPAPVSGRYELSMVAGEHKLDRVIYYRPLAENDPDTPVDPVLQALADKHELLRWEEGDYAKAFVNEPVDQDSRAIFLCLALVLWVGIICKEFSVAYRIRRLLYLYAGVRFRESSSVGFSSTGTLSTMTGIYFSRNSKRTVINAQQRKLLIVPVRRDGRVQPTADKNSFAVETFSR